MLKTKKNLGNFDIKSIDILCVCEWKNIEYDDQLIMNRLMSSYCGFLINFAKHDDYCVGAKGKKRDRDRDRDKDMANK